MGDLIALLMATLAGMLTPGATETQLEQKLAAVVQKEQPAPLKSVTVDVTGVKGTALDKVEFHFTELLMDQLMVDGATFTVTDVKRGQDGKLAIGGITWRAKIADGALTTALRAQGGKMKNSTVTITPDGLTLCGKWPMGITKVGYSVTGNLSAEDETQLMFHIEKSKVSGIGVPGGINGMIEKEVNPVYDLAKFAARSKKEIDLAREKLNYNFELRVKTIAPRGGHIIVSGSA